MTASNSSVPRRAFLRSATAATTATGATGVAAAQEGQSKTVEMNDDLKFVPAELTIAPGTTVVWENVGSIVHSVTAYEDEIPDEASYFTSGGFDAEQPARSAYPDSSIEGGGTYEYTFDTEGTFDYFCIPHETAGMTGSISVQQGGGAEEGGGGESVPQVPDSAKTLGVATSGAMGTPSQPTISDRHCRRWIAIRRRIPASMSCFTARNYLQRILHSGVSARSVLTSPQRSHSKANATATCAANETEFDRVVLDARPVVVIARAKHQNTLADDLDGFVARTYRLRTSNAEVVMFIDTRQSEQNGRAISSRESHSWEPRRLPSNWALDDWAVT